MKISIKTAKMSVAVLVAALLFTACASQKKSTPVANVNEQGQQLGPDGQPIVTIKRYDPLLIKENQFTLEQFGPNPYIQQAPTVLPDAQKAFKDAMDDIEDENFDFAEKKLQILVDDYPILSGAAYNLAMLKYKQGDLEKAEEYANIALNRNYYNQAARNLVAVIYREKGDFAKSEEIHKENLAVWGGYAESYRNLGVLYDLYMGNIEEAVSYYKQYNALQDEQNRQVLGWTMDIERRLKAKADAEEAERQAQAAAQEAEMSAEAGVVAEGEVGEGASTEGQAGTVESVDESAEPESGESQQQPALENDAVSDDSAVETEAAAEEPAAVESEVENTPEVSESEETVDETEVEGAENE